MFSAFHNKPQPNYVPWAFIGGLFLFVFISLSRPVVGLSGSGAILILGAVLVELNREAIWQNYKKSYKPGSSKLDKVWSEPKQIYYKLNVYVVWPLVFAFGALSIAAAYLLD